MLDPFKRVKLQKELAYEFLFISKEKETIFKDIMEIINPT